MIAVGALGLVADKTKRTIVHTVNKHDRTVRAIYIGNVRWTVGLFVIQVQGYAAANRGGSRGMTNRAERQHAIMIDNTYHLHR